MRSRGVAPVFVMALLGACSSVSPRPEVADAAALPQVQLTAEQSTEAMALVERAVDAIAERRFDDAGDAANDALAIDPRSARARAVLGLVHQQRARAADPPSLAEQNAGEVELRLASQLAPDDAIVGWMHARFLAEVGHLSAAATIAEAALERATDASAAERALLASFAATCRYELGEERAALPHLREYVAFRGDDAAAHFRLGVCLLRIAATSPGPFAPDPTVLDQAEEAARAFDRCVELSPDDADAALAAAAATWRVAELADRAGDDKRRAELAQATAERLQAIATRFPSDPEPVFRLGVVAEARNAPAEARAAYEHALERDPRHVPSLLNLAAMFDAAGEGAEVVALLQRAVDADAERTQLTVDERRAVLARVRRP